MGQRQQQVGVAEPRLCFVVWVGLRRGLTCKEGAVTTPQIRGTELVDRTLSREAVAHCEEEKRVTEWA